MLKAPSGQRIVTEEMYVRELVSPSQGWRLQNPTEKTSAAPGKNQEPHRMIIEEQGRKGKTRSRNGPPLFLTWIKGK